MSEESDAQIRLNPFGAGASAIRPDHVETPEPEPPAPQESAHFKALRDQVRAKDAELAEVRREIAFERAGIDVSSGPGALLYRSLSNESTVPTPEALRASARFYNVPLKGDVVPERDEVDDE